MNTVVRQRCKTNHIFQLLFDATELISCETQIREFLGRGIILEYSTYNSSVSQPFLQMVETVWKNLNDVRIGIRHHEAQVNTNDNSNHEPAASEADWVPESESRSLLSFYHRSAYCEKQWNPAGPSIVDEKDCRADFSLRTTRKLEGLQ